MKTDTNGCSTTVAGDENYEPFYSPVLRKNLIQYDYRTNDNRLFSCVGKTLEDCRRKRDIWLSKNIIETFW